MTDFANLLRIRWTLFRNTLQTIKTANTGHLGACCSSLDLFTVLYFGGILRYDIKNPKHGSRDYVINRGHLGPLKYNIFSLLGWMDADEMSQYRQYNSRLAGHEDIALTPGVDLTPSGSLGMGLSYAVGACVGFRDLNMPNRVFCFVGDGESQEGNIMEAAIHAAHLKIPNLICIVDKNGGQLSTRLKETDSANLEVLWKGYGWQVISLPNGHDLTAVHAAYIEACEAAKNGPVCIVAHTIKGNGIPGCEADYCGFHVFHGSEAHEDVRSIDIDAAFATIPPEHLGNFIVPRARLPRFRHPITAEVKPIALPEVIKTQTIYDVEHAFIKALDEQIGNRLYILTADYPPRSFVYGQDGDTPFPRAQYYNMGLREQHVTAFAHGLSRIRPDCVLVILCGDAFLYRHMDQINVLAQAGTPVILYSVQGGLSGAKNGSTHQSSGQSGAILMMPGIVSEEPCSAEDFIEASNRALLRKAPTYIRLQRLPIPWSLKGKREQGYEVVAHNPDALGTIVSCGMITLESVGAIEKLAKLGTPWNLINISSPSDCAGFGKYIVAGKPVLALYNGFPKIISAILFEELFRNGNCSSSVYVRGFEHGVTGTTVELLKHFKLDAESIVQQCSTM